LAATREVELVEQQEELHSGQCKGHGKRRTQPGNAADRQSRRLIATLYLEEMNQNELVKG